MSESEYWAGRSALITGSTRGIGEATARRLALLGASVVVHGTDTDRGYAVARDIGGNAVFVAADLREADGPQRVVDEAWEAVGGLDVLVNNAGANRFHGVLGATSQQYSDCLDLDLRAYWLAARRFVERGGARGGAIVNVSSNHARATMAGIFPYNVAKAGVQALTQSLAIELAALGYRANAVVPGYIDTPINDAYLAGFADPDGERRRVERLHPLGRIGRPDDVARAVAFLANDEESGFVTGASLLVDGGRSALLQDPVPT